MVMLNVLCGHRTINNMSGAECMSLQTTYVLLVGYVSTSRI